jgi:hypothetical protein
VFGPRTRMPREHGNGSYCLGTTPLTRVSGVRRPGPARDGPTHDGWRPATYVGRLNGLLALDDRVVCEHTGSTAALAHLSHGGAPSVLRAVAVARRRATITFDLVTHQRTGAVAFAARVREP